MNSTKTHLNWTNIIFFITLPIVAITGTVLLCVFVIVRWPTWILAGAYTILTGLAITGGYHRLFSHSTYKAAWPLKLLMLLFGAAAFQGSALEWCTDHRNHHRFTDTDKDPYSIQKGFWYAHIGWLFTLDTRARDFSNVEDLQKDKLVYLQHKYYLWIAIAMGFVLPLGIGMLWGDPLGGLIIAGALRLTFNHHVTFAINSVCHFFGKRTYSDRQSARDNWLTAFFTYGEGYHNFHHQFPLDYRNGIRFYDFDPTKWLIKALSWVGLARDLKRVSEHRIIRYRIQMEEKWLAAKLDVIPESVLGQFKKIADPVRANIYQALARIESIEKEYISARLQTLGKMYVKISNYRIDVKACRRQLKAARQELKSYLAIWENVLKYSKHLTA